MDTKKSLEMSVEEQNDDSQILQPFSLTGYVDKELANDLRIGTTFNCLTRQPGPQLALENIQTQRISHSEASCKEVKSLNSIMNAYALSALAAGRFLKLFQIDLSLKKDNSTSSTEERNHFLYSHIIQKERRYLNTNPDTNNAAKSCTHYVDSAVYGGYMFIHSTSKIDNHETGAKKIMESGISFMGRKAGLNASKNSHSESTESQLSHHIISSIPINGFSKNEDIVKSFISKYEKEETDLSPISFHFKPLPGVKSQVGSIQDLSSSFTKIENQFHFKEDFVGINPKKAVQDYNSLQKKFWEDLEKTEDVGKDVGELSTIQAYIGWVKSCAGLLEAKDAIGRLIMKNDYTVTGEDKEKVILLIGKVGQGKSSVGNYLIGKDEFIVSNLSRGETQKIKEGRCTVMSEENETLIVYDTPGFFEVCHRSKVATSEIKSQWSTGVHAFVWVLRSDFPDDVDMVLDKLKKKLFKGITKHMIIAFTFCEDPRFTIQGLLDKNLKFKELSTLVGQRVIGIRSKNPLNIHDYEKQETRKALLNLVNIIDNKRGKYIP